MRLIAGGKTLTAPLTVVMDPRVKTPTADLKQQFDISTAIYADMLRATAAIHEITVVRDHLKEKATHTPVASAGDSLEKKLDQIAGAEQGECGPRLGPAGPPTLESVRMQFARVEHEIQDADEAPTASQQEAYHTAWKPLASLVEQWNQGKQGDLKAINEKLQHQHLSMLRLNTSTIDHSVEDQVELGDEE